MYCINCDASIQPFNPGGLVAWAFIVKQNKEIIHKDHNVSVRGGPMATGNVGEYHAVIAALHWLISRPKKLQNIPAIIMSDSEVVINQLNGDYRCHEPRLAKLNEIAKKAVKQYNSRIIFKWVPRKKNKEADAYSREAYDENELQYFRDNQIDIIFEEDDIQF